MTPVRRRLALSLILLIAVGACSDDDAGPSDASEQAASTTPATECATTPAPDGRLVRVTIDDVVDGFGSLGLAADGGLTPGTVRIEVTGDVGNASPLGVSIVRDGVEVATVDGVAAGETCGIDLEVSEGTYHVTDGDRDVEFTVEA